MTVSHFTRLTSWVTLLLDLYVFSTSALGSQEMYPKRLGSSNASSQFPPGSSDSLSNPQSYSNRNIPIHATSCSLSCFLRPPEHEYVLCGSHESSPAQTNPANVIGCSLNQHNGRITIGTRQSVRTIVPGTLGQLKAFDVETQLRTGSMSLHLNLNMMRLYARTFSGLDDVLTAVQLMNVMQMHPDTLIDLRHLHAFVIGSHQLPELTFATYLDPHTDASGNSSQPVKDGLPLAEFPKNLPFFIRLRPLDLNEPISFNLPVSCHQCTDSLNPDTTLIVIRFTELSTMSEAKDSANSANSFSSLSILIPQTCPQSSDAIGCVANYSLTEDGIISASAISWHNQLLSSDSSTPTYLIFLSIWSLVLTTLVVFAILIIYICARRFYRRKGLPDWLVRHWFRGRRRQQPIAEACKDEVDGEYSNSSSSSEYYVEPASIEAFDRHQSRRMLNGGPSWSNMRYSRATSAYNIKDKPYKAKHHASTSAMRPPGRGGTASQYKRRSIGSQTDFTEIESLDESNAYPSLSRSRGAVVDYAPQRTSSQFMLANPRYSLRWDSLFPRHSQQVALVNNELDTSVPIVGVMSSSAVGRFDIAYPITAQLPPLHPSSSAKSASVARAATPKLLISDNDHPASGIGVITNGFNNGHQLPMSDME